MMDYCGKDNITFNFGMVKPSMSLCSGPRGNEDPGCKAIDGSGEAPRAGQPKSNNRATA
jgi:hypothetical protein